MKLIQMEPSPLCKVCKSKNAFFLALEGTLGRISNLQLYPFLIQFFKELRAPALHLWMAFLHTSYDIKRG